MYIVAPPPLFFKLPRKLSWTMYTFHSCAVTRCNTRQQASMHGNARQRASRTAWDWLGLVRLDMGLKQLLLFYFSWYPWYMYVGHRELRLYFIVYINLHSVYLPLSILNSTSICQYVFPEDDGYKDFGISWSTSRILRWTRKIPN